MVRHQLFSKGENIYALISNFRHPNILFPVQCTIYDVKFDALMPQYQIRIKHFYDDSSFLKRYFFGLTFKGNFEDKQTKINLRRELYTNVEAIEKQINDKWESYLIVVDSVFCVKTKADMRVLFNSLQDFFIEKTIKDLYELTNRITYNKGTYYYHARGEFEASIKKFLGDRVPDDKKYFEKLLFRPDAKDLDGIESN